MKKILQTPLFVLIGLVILSLTIFLCGLNITTENIAAIVTAIYIPLTIYLIIISINTSKDAIKISREAVNVHTPDNLTTLRRSKLTTSELVF